MLKLTEKDFKNISKLLPKEKLVEAITLLAESNVIIKSLEKTQNQIIDENKDEITVENWEYIKSALEFLVKERSFQLWCQEINAKLYTVKYFTDIKFVLPKNLEHIIKKDLKNYFTFLSVDTHEDFFAALKNLPFEFTSLVVRYINDKVKSEDLLPSIEQGNKYVEQIKKKKINFIEMINKISKGEGDTFPTNDLELLLDARVFYKYNALNVGTLEFIIRLIKNDKSKELKDILGQTKVNALLKQALYNPSYIEFIKKIKSEETQPYFNEDGTQNTERETTYDQYVQNLLHPENVIPKRKETPTAPAAVPETPQVPEAPVAENPDDLSPTKPEEEPKPEPQSPTGTQLV